MRKAGAAYTRRLEERARLQTQRKATEGYIEHLSTELQRMKLYDGRCGFMSKLAKNIEASSKIFSTNYKKFFHLLVYCCPTVVVPMGAEQRSMTASIFRM
jgi:hypothetical protein